MKLDLSNNDFILAVLVHRTVPGRGFGMMV